MRIGYQYFRISGWDDRDGGGGFYQNYFTNKTSYTVSNAPTEDKGLGSIKESYIKEIALDLSVPLPKELERQFDVIFNHTTLKHIINSQLALENLCAMSKGAVIIVVPLIQQIHILGSYGDYWRPTTLGLAKIMKKCGLEPLVIKSNDQPFTPVYCFAIGVRYPKKYEGKIERYLDFKMGGALYGSSLKQKHLDKLLKE